MTKINSPQTPDLAALLAAAKTDLFASLNCHQIGTIVAFDPVKQSASVQIVNKRVVGDEVLDYPLLVDVPVVFPAGGGAFFSFPVKAGDNCLVLFNDRDIDVWFTNGASTAPNSPRMHSLADGIALVGLRNATNPSVETGEDVVLRFAGATILISPAGKIGITAGPNGNNLTLYEDGTVQLTGVGQVNITALDVNKIHLNNGVTTLRSVLDNLMTTLTLWQNTGGSSPGVATLARIAAVQSEVDSLLS